MLTVMPRVTMNPDTQTVQFEGAPFDAAVSFFLVDNEPGQGPDLHQHPYAEVFTIVSGRALITAGDEQIEAGREHIAVVGPDTPHGFRNLGPGRLEIVCIHANPKMITTWLQPER
ncbi:MAG: cupin domain-containing protein [Nitriliruptorales bacterium]|nr:cupin domain-containing protein [Nitriliruptorales bacterium]